MGRYFCQKYQRDLTYDDVRHHSCFTRPNRYYRAKSPKPADSHQPYEKNAKKKRHTKQIKHIHGTHKCRHLFILEKASE